MIYEWFSQSSCTLSLFNDVLEKCFDDLDRCRLWYDFIHLMSPSLLDIFDFSVSCTGDDHGLLNTLSFEVSPNFVRSLITVHERHLTVHKDETVCVPATLHALPHFIKGILTIIRYICDILNIFIVTLFQDDLHAQRVEWFIVNN